MSLAPKPPQQRLFKPRPKLGETFPGSDLPVDDLLVDGKQFTQLEYADWKRANRRSNFDTAARIQYARALKSDPVLLDLVMASHMAHYDQYPDEAYSDEARRANARAFIARARGNEPTLADVLPAKTQETRTKMLRLIAQSETNSAKAKEADIDRVMLSAIGDEGVLGLMNGDEKVSKKVNWAKVASAIGYSNDRMNPQSLKVAENWARERFLKMVDKLSIHDFNALLLNFDDDWASQTRARYQEFLRFLTKLREAVNTQAFKTWAEAEFIDHLQPYGVLVPKDERKKMRNVYWDETTESVKWGKGGNSVFPYTKPVSINSPPTRFFFHVVNTFYPAITQGTLTPRTRARGIQFARDFVQKVFSSIYTSGSIASLASRMRKVLDVVAFRKRVHSKQKAKALLKSVFSPEKFSEWMASLGAKSPKDPTFVSALNVFENTPPSSWVGRLIMLGITPAFSSPTSQSPPPAIRTGKPNGKTQSFMWERSDELKIMIDRGVKPTKIEEVVPELNLSVIVNKVALHPLSREFELGMATDNDYLSENQDFNETRGVFPMTCTRHMYHEICSLLLNHAHHDFSKGGAYALLRFTEKEYVSMAGGILTAGRFHSLVVSHMGCVSPIDGKWVYANRGLPDRQTLEGDWTTWTEELKQTFRDNWSIATGYSDNSGWSQYWRHIAIETKYFQVAANHPERKALLEYKAAVDDSADLTRPEYRENKYVQYHRGLSEDDKKNLFNAETGKVMYFESMFAWLGFDYSKMEAFIEQRFAQLFLTYLTSYHNVGKKTTNLLVNFGYVNITGGYQQVGQHQIRSTHGNSGATTTFHTNDFVAYCIQQYARSLGVRTPLAYIDAAGSVGTKLTLERMVAIAPFHYGAPVGQEPLDIDQLGHSAIIINRIPLITGRFSDNRKIIDEFSLTWTIIPRLEGVRAIDAAASHKSDSEQQSTISKANKTIAEANRNLNSIKVDLADIKKARKDDPSQEEIDEMNEREAKLVKQRKDYRVTITTAQEKVSKAKEFEIGSIVSKAVSLFVYYACFDEALTLLFMGFLEDMHRNKTWVVSDEHSIEIPPHLIEMLKEGPQVLKEHVIIELFSYPGDNVLVTGEEGETVVVSGELPKITTAYTVVAELANTVPEVKAWLKRPQVLKPGQDWKNFSVPDTVIAAVRRDSPENRTTGSATLAKYLRTLKYYHTFGSAWDSKVQPAAEPSRWVTPDEEGQPDYVERDVKDRKQIAVDRKARKNAQRERKASAVVAEDAAPVLPKAPKLPVFDEKQMQTLRAKLTKLIAANNPRSVYTDLRSNLRPWRRNVKVNDFTTSEVSSGEDDKRYRQSPRAMANLEVLLGFSFERNEQFLRPESAYLQLEPADLKVNRGDVADNYSSHEIAHLMMMWLGRLLVAMGAYEWLNLQRRVRRVNDDQPSLRLTFLFE